MLGTKEKSFYHFNDFRAIAHEPTGMTSKVRESGITPGTNGAASVEIQYSKTGKTIFGELSTQQNYCIDCKLITILCDFVAIGTVVRLVLSFKPIYIYIYGLQSPNPEIHNTHTVPVA